MVELAVELHFDDLAPLEDNMSEGERYKADSKAWHTYSVVDVGTNDETLLSSICTVLDTDNVTRLLSIVS